MLCNIQKVLCIFALLHMSNIKILIHQHIRLTCQTNSQNVRIPGLGPLSSFLISSGCYQQALTKMPLDSNTVASFVLKLQLNSTLKCVSELIKGRK